MTLDLKNFNSVKPKEWEILKSLQKVDKICDIAREIYEISEKVQYYKKKLIKLGLISQVNNTILLTKRGENYLKYYKLKND